MGRGFWRFLGGTLFGLGVAYVVLSKLDEEDRGRLRQSVEGLLENAGLGDRSQSMLDDVQARLQYAIDEGKQAAAQVRAELEASTHGASHTPNGTKPSAGTGSI